jgi:hypothetical protein
MAEGIMEDKPQIKVKVLDKPATFIMIDADRNPEEAKFLWLKAHDISSVPPSVRKYDMKWTARQKRHRTT